MRSTPPDPTMISSVPTGESIKAATGRWMLGEALVGVEVKEWNDWCITLYFPDDVDLLVTTNNSISVDIYSNECTNNGSLNFTFPKIMMGTIPDILDDL